MHAFAHPPSIGGLALRYLFAFLSTFLLHCNVPALEGSHPDTSHPSIDEEGGIKTKMGTSWPASVVIMGSDKLHSDLLYLGSLMLIRKLDLPRTSSPWIGYSQTPTLSGDILKCVRGVDSRCWRRYGKPLLLTNFHRIWNGTVVLKNGPSCCYFTRSACCVRNV